MVRDFAPVLQREVSLGVRWCDRHACDPKFFQASTRPMCRCLHRAEAPNDFVNSFDCPQPREVRC